MKASRWVLGSEAELDLVDKLETKGKKLREVIKVDPLNGIKTGMNKAYLLSTPEREKLVAAHPDSAALFRPYIEGENCDRWSPALVGLWMVVMKSSATTPGRGRKRRRLRRRHFSSRPTPGFTHTSRSSEPNGGTRRSGPVLVGAAGVRYWDAFDKPKIMYQDIAWDLRFSLDRAGMLANNTVYFLPVEDPWVLAVLNAPVSWWLAWRTAQHGKDEALRFFTDYLVDFPVPEPAPELRETVIRPHAGGQRHAADGVAALGRPLGPLLRPGRLGRLFAPGLLAEDELLFQLRERPPRPV